VPSLKQIKSALEPYLGDHADVVLKEGAARLGIAGDDLSASDAANLLKRFAYRELQREMDAAKARAVIKEILSELGGEEQKAGAEIDPKTKLQAALARYSLYFEWPEVQRLRSLAALIEASESEGQSASELIKEAQAQIELLDEKLQNSLLRQARDISYLEEAIERVKSIGGPKLRRLHSLLKQIKEAQLSDTLATAEVERARKLAAEMRKLVESSVVQNPTLASETKETEEGVIAVDDVLESVPEDLEDDNFELLIDFESLEPDVADRIREIELAEERRRLELLKEQYAAIWPTAEVGDLAKEVEDSLDRGDPVGDKLNQLQLALDDAFKNALAEARARYEWLSERLRSLDLEGDLATGRAHSQLELIKESLEMGILPGDLEEAERQIKDLEDALERRRAEEARRERILQEAKNLTANAKEALSGEDLPELSGFKERLALLEASLEAGEVDESLLARLKAELPDMLNVIARSSEATKALRARLVAELESLPPLAEIKNSIDSLKLQVNELAPEELEAQVSKLRQQALELSRQKLLELADLARRFKLSDHQVQQALAELNEEQFPDLEGVRQRLEAAVENARSQSKQALERLAAAARRLEGMGGESLLSEIQAALDVLPRELPNTSPLEDKLNQLLRQREELREKLGARYREVRQRFEKARHVSGETAYQAQTLLNFLEKGAERLKKLGTSGLREFERSLNEAEKLVAQLEEEYAAAKQVAQQLKSSDLEDLLGVFESPKTPSQQEPQSSQPTSTSTPEEDELAPFQIRGVLWAHKIGSQSQNNENVDPALIKALYDDLNLLKEEIGAREIGAAVVTFSDHALLLSPLSDDLAVVMAERPLLSRLMSLAKGLKEAP